VGVIVSIQEEMSFTCFRFESNIKLTNKTNEAIQFQLMASSLPPVENFSNCKSKSNSETQSDNSQGFSKARSQTVIQSEIL